MMRQGNRRGGWAALVATAVLAGSGWVEAREVFVSPSGKDDALGTLEQPFATLAKAAQVAKPGDTCYLRAGVYREVLRPARSGEDGALITFAAYEDEEAILSGADPLIAWKQEGDGVWSATMPWTLADGNQVLAGGEMLSEACWPAAGERHLFQPERASATGGSPTTLVCPQFPGTDDSWKGARLWCAGGAAWICWNAEVTAYDAESKTLTFDKAQDKWYVPRAGSLFSLRGLRRCLHAPGQWFYDQERKRMLLIPPRGNDPNVLAIGAKRRNLVVDLSDRSHVCLRGLSLQAGAIRTNQGSSHLTFESLVGRHLGHSYRWDHRDRSGLMLDGANHLVLDCDLGFSSGPVLVVKGRDHRIINCNLHHGGYAGLWGGAVSLSGRRILFSHNTVRHAGRDLIGTHGLMESLVQFNDVSEAGWLTKDLGMFYGHNTDFANTQFRYNLVHDNHAKHCAMGIYFDHLSHNAIVHHNVVWNVGMDPLRFNNPSYCNLTFNNTCWNTGLVSTFDHSKREDLFASRFFNNIINVPVRLPDHVARANNHVIDSPVFKDAKAFDFRLAGDGLAGAGAMTGENAPWRAGCTPGQIPDPLPKFEKAQLPWMNGLRNACFELGTLEGWMRESAAEVNLTKGNGWGNSVLGSDKAHATGTSNYELQIGPKPGAVSQLVPDLQPNTRYELSAWLRVSNAEEEAVLGVSGHGGEPLRVSSDSPDWTRKTLTFTTGPNTRTATVSVRKASSGGGRVWADNFVLPLNPGE